MKNRQGEQKNDKLRERDTERERERQGLIGWWKVKLQRLIGVCGWFGVFMCWRWCEGMVDEMVNSDEWSVVVGDD